MTIDASIRTVIFDLDGTLYNKKGLACKMVCRLWWCLPLLVSERLTRKKMDCCHYGSEETFYTAFFTTMSRGHWWSAAIARRWYEKVYMPTMVQMISQHCPLNVRAQEMIRACQAQGVQMVLFSDYGWEKEKLQGLGIDSSVFAYCLNGPRMGGLKPEKETINRLMNYIGAVPQSTLFVGDREDKDGESARVVGARFVNITK